jgi:ribosomal protein L7/L12
MPDELDNEQIRQVTDALAGGKKIQAIKLYREFTGKNLIEAKEFIDELIPKLKEQDPERYASLDEKSAGCASVILAGLGLATLTYWWM